MTLMTIGELARRSAVPVTTLRYYDRIGLLVPARLGNNHRRYPPEVLDRLRLIQLCRALGCSLDETAAVLEPGGGAARRTVARRKLADVERRMAELVAARAVLTHLAACEHTAETAAECRAATVAAWHAVRDRDASLDAHDPIAVARRARTAAG